MKGPEQGAGLILLPILSTLAFYLSPQSLQHNIAYQFLPQALAYVGLFLWSRLNTHPIHRLGLQTDRFAAVAGWGLLVGCVLGGLNVLVILRIMPWLGIDMTFLKQTPHASIPLWVMMPWFICLIAVFVELNFRGFLLGRLLALSVPPPLAVAISAVLFSFDPFMVATFRDLHWIAVWDGVVWGFLWITLRSLYATIVAHAVEVMVMYSVVRATLN